MIKPRVSHQVSVEDQFGNLCQEPQRLPLRAPKVFMNRSLKKIMDGCDEFLGRLARERTKENAVLGMQGDYEYGLAQGIAPERVRYQDLEMFMAYMGHYETFNESDKIGFYISALLSSCTSRDIEIDIRHFGRTIDYVAYGLTRKRLTIHGNVGFHVGRLADHSRLVVHGNVSTSFFDTAYCSLGVVTGNLGDHGGFHMNKSRLFVRGNTGDNIGFDAHNSKIHVNGNYPLFLNYIYQKSLIIYHKGKKIYPPEKQP